MRNPFIIIVPILFNLFILATFNSTQEQDDDMYQDQPKMTVCDCEDENNTLICGSNLVTYWNECFFNCALDNSPSLTLVRTGRCFDAPTPDDYEEEDFPELFPEYSEEYYSDLDLEEGVTVPPRNKYTSLSKVYVTPEQKQELKDCSCNKKYDPFCSAHRTFFNYCMFNCTQGRDETVDAGHFGECKNEDV